MNQLTRRRKYINACPALLNSITCMMYYRPQTICYLDSGPVEDGTLHTQHAEPEDPPPRVVVGMRR